ncbi:MAG: ABC transporter ATP-binding protein [Nanoarchaeota archaeon]|nr:ABC transporter ATP-binding protein [Nanoarchaeota archaeon]
MEFIQKPFNMENFSIVATNLSLKYKIISSISLKKQVFLIGDKFNKSTPNQNKKSRILEIEALKNVSFNVKTGEVIGIIGLNGSGKTTLLKTLAGIFRPDSGEVKLSSNSVSLLTLGAGFELDLSGYENIFLSGLLLGFSKKQLKEITREIIDFSGLGDFIYNPVGSYSSGMRSRLAFSISSCIEPDILLIDEVLGVGDEGFKEKSSKRIKEFFYSNKTVVFATHNLMQAIEICNSVLWLEKGQVVMHDSPKKTVNKYREFIRKME